MANYKGLLYSPEVLGGIGLLTAGLSGRAPDSALPMMMQGMKTASMFRAMEDEEEKRKFIKEFGSSIPEEDQAFFKAYPKVYLQNKYKKKGTPNVKEIFKDGQTKMFDLNKESQLKEFLNLTNNEGWTAVAPKKDKSDIKTKLLMIPDENNKYGTPRTFNMSLKEDVEEFNNLIDKKGVYEVKAPAVVSSSFEGMKQPPEKSSKGAWEKEIKGHEDQIANLERMDIFYDPRFLQIQGKVGKELYKILDQFNIAKKDQVQFLQQYGNWKQAQEQFFNAYRKLITGVAAGEKEIAWIQASIPSSKDSPSVYRSKVKLQKEITKGIIQRAKKFKGGFEKALDADGRPTKEFQEFLKKEGLRPSFDVVSATEQLYLSQGYDDETMEKIMNLTFENIDWFEILQAGAN